MSMIALALTLAAAGTTPSTEAVTLGRELARSGEITTLITTFSSDQLVDQLVGMYVDLPSANRGKLCSIALDEARRQRETFYDKIGMIYARELSVKDLRYLVATSLSPASRRFRELAGKMFMEVESKIEFQEWMLIVTNRFCKETGELCAKALPPKVESR